jgi:hypothetical protein
MNITELKMNIRKVKDVGELRQLNRFVVDCIKSKRTIEGMGVKSQLFEGAKVFLKSQYCRGKSAYLFEKEGTITKMNPKKARVQFEGDFRTWIIPYEQIEAR